MEVSVIPMVKNLNSPVADEGLIELATLNLVSLYSLCMYVNLCNGWI